MFCMKCLKRVGVRNKRQSVPVNACRKHLLVRSAQPKCFKIRIALQTSAGLSSVWGLICDSQELFFCIFLLCYLCSLHTLVSLFIKTMKISDSFQVY